MRKLLIYVVPQLISPGISGYFLWHAKNAEGWGGLAYGAFLGLVAIISGAIGLAVLLLAIVLKFKGVNDWHWLVASAGIVGSPAIVAIFLQAFG